MITLEEQIRRYATDVAGPAVGEGPADLAELGRPTHRGRWLLVAALVLFVAGLGYVVADSTLTPTPPTATTVPLRQPTSWGGAEGACSESVPVGVLVDGPAGGGLCVGTGSDERGISVWFVIDGEPRMNSIYDICTLATAPWSISAGAVPSDDGTVAANLYALPGDVATFVAKADGIDDITVDTFHVPGVDSLSFAAFWSPTNADLGYYEQFRIDGTPYVPQGTPPSSPAVCPLQPGRG